MNVGIGCCRGATAGSINRQIALRMFQSELEAGDIEHEREHKLPFLFFFGGGAALSGSNVKAAPNEYQI